MNSQYFSLLSKSGLFFLPLLIYTQNILAQSDSVVCYQSIIQKESNFQIMIFEKMGLFVDLQNDHFRCSFYKTHARSNELEPINIYDWAGLDFKIIDSNLFVFVGNANQFLEEVTLEIYKGGLKDPHEIEVAFQNYGFAIDASNIKSINAKYRVFRGPYVMMGPISLSRNKFSIPLRVNQTVFESVKKIRFRFFPFNKTAYFLYASRNPPFSKYRFRSNKMLLSLYVNEKKELEYKRCSCDSNFYNPVLLDLINDFQRSLK